MANLTYRVNSNPALPPASIVKGAPLTNLEVDANFKALDASLDTVQTQITQVSQQANQDAVALAIALG